ncbi:MerR family transcriptional regulator [Clostridium botulinum]|uniref:MerR family transcriptional regulator n=1 Tax=Clostridium botulinum TaxID=1491 RepID=UPI0030EF87A4
MRTVKQVSDLAGISVRALHYYDEIGLLKPSEITEAGYRLYDDEALKTLQQILFFKELDIPLKDVKEIMSSPYFDKMEALKNQKKMLMLKRKRLDGLIELINKTLKGANTMSFKEFDMTEYYNVLEEFKKENKDRVITNWGSIDKFDEMIEKMKANETKIAKNIIKQYGSIKKCAEAVRNELNNDTLITRKEKYDTFKNDFLYDKHPKLKELYKKLTTDLSKDPSSKEIQQIVYIFFHHPSENIDIFNTICSFSLYYNPNNSLTWSSFSNNKHPPSCSPSNISLSLSFLNNGDFKASLKLHSFKLISEYGENGHGSAPPLAFI